MPTFVVADVIAAYHVFNVAHPLSNASIDVGLFLTEVVEHLLQSCDVTRQVCVAAIFDITSSCKRLVQTSHLTLDRFQALHNVTRIDVWGMT